MVTVKFHGDLKRFEPKEGLSLCVENFSELMSGLLTQIQGLCQHLRQGYYKVRVGRRYLSEAQIKTHPIALNDDCTVHFTPVVAGAGKNGGLFQVIAGIVIIAASIISYQWYGVSYGTALMMGTMGASMAIGGAVQMLSRPPDMNSKLGDSEKQQSTSFSNLRNLTPQGRPIPLLYGEMMSSIVLISQGIDTFDAMSEQDKAELDKLRQQEAVSVASVGRILSEQERIQADKEEDARQARQDRSQERAEERAEQEQQQERERFERQERQGQHMII